VLSFVDIHLVARGYVRWLVADMNPELSSLPEGAGGRRRPVRLNRTRDAPGTYAAQYGPVAVDGDVVVGTGTSSYRDRPDGAIVRVYHNCYVMRCDADGRCREFTEYYIRRP
jgi:hypothetical protein